MRTEWVIHIWGKEREILEFTPQEKFHMDMIRNSDHSIFDKVLINIAMYDVNDNDLFDLLKTELLNVFSDIKEVDIRKCQNDRMLCEYVTFRPYVWDRIGEDVRIFYSHFKGYISNVQLLGKYAYPKRNLLINEYYWSYLMYRMSLDKEYVNEMQMSFDIGKDIYCWCLFDDTNLEYVNIIEGEDYHFRHHLIDRLCVLQVVLVKQILAVLVEHIDKAEREFKLGDKFKEREVEIATSTNLEHAIELFE